MPSPIWGHVLAILGHILAALGRVLAVLRHVLAILGQILTVCVLYNVYCTRVCSISWSYKYTFLFRLTYIGGMIVNKKTRVSVHFS